MRKTFTYDGKRYSVQRKTKRELEAAIEKKKRLLREGRERDINISFIEYAHTWFQIYKLPYVSDRTSEMYRTAINHIHIRKRVCDVTTADLQSVIEELARTHGKSSVDKVVLTMKQIFRQACVDGVIKNDPTRGLVRHRKKQNRRRALTKEEEKMIMDYCPHSRYGTWVLSMLCLGLRPSETALLKKKDIKDGYVHVRGTKSAKADRLIPLPEALVFDLTEFDEEDDIFVTDANTSLTKQSMTRWWKYFKRELNLYYGAKTYRNKIIEPVIAEDITPYTLRHTFGTRAQQAGIPIDVLADLMGHESIETTRKYYISDNLESKEAQREKLNSMWR